MGVRIFSLAKELNMTSKELMAYLETQGHNVKNHMCTIPDTVAQILRDRLPKRQAKLAAVAGTSKPKAAGNGSGVAGTESPARQQPSSLQRPPSIVGKAKPVSPPSTTARPAAPAAPAPVLEAGDDEEKREKGGKDDKRIKGKDQHPTRKRVFPGSPDFGMDVTTRLAGTRRGLRRLEPSHPTKDGESATGAEPKVVTVAPPITVKDLSAAIGIKANLIIQRLLGKNMLLTINSNLNEEQILSITRDFGIEVSVKKEHDIEEEIKALENYKSPPENLQPRAPVVTFMGHVDHGKTSLLDKIRETNITKSESGGITQHLGAYRVDKGDVHVVFIDTPGHEAFTEMRARGANVTDLVVLVVAADDGPKPQTKEAVDHARAAGVPIVVAINKIDKTNANTGMCRDLLAKMDLIPVEWGGSTEYVEVSALTSQGIDNLLETVSLESQILDLKADPKRSAVGTVLEAEQNTGRGILATILVQDGTLHVGDYVLCGPAHGRVRNMWLNGREAITEAPPATPVQLSGLSIVPDAGDRLYVVSDPQKAREIADDRFSKKRALEWIPPSKPTLENLFERMKESLIKEVRIVLKADVKGSLEVLQKSLNELATQEVKVRLLHSGVGGISQTDVDLADAEGAIVLGFHVVPDDRARAIAEERRVEIRQYQVIYELIDDVRAAMENKLAPVRREQVKGHLRIQQVFRSSKYGNIAGCRVTDGTISRTDKVRLVRESRVVYSGDIATLKRLKDDVREVKEGFECGVKITNYEDIKEGDTIESFSIVEEKRNL